ncbi:N-acetylneuraminate synthase family protein [Leptospira ilyithenensis]|uniref:N-acetyl neuraminic (Sialic) acid synthetase n=1 Tax=Leptospira ilyithenensis TaxID=2484901 RepID=A0A4R9LNY9_9LEPT|nr:N-acetylneuraminate synthase family protein [Leptospira ilyithenensis]TGN10485.1 N-acetyl neuraminic (sialic) acid synthetase [Leptospira ilyithenensis]
MDFRIDNQVLTRNTKPYLIAEIGLNHNNDSEIGKKTIRAAKEAGADAVKFQSYVTEDFVDPKNQEAKFLFDIFKEYELSETKHREFQKTAIEEGLDFFSTPLDSISVDLLVSLKVPVLKIASGDIVNYPLLKKAIDTKLPLVVSTGAALPFEVTRALDLFKEENAEIALLHCVSLYPTPANKANLQTIPYFLETTPYVVGFSDHTDGFLAASVAVGLGASIIEKHFTLDRSLPGPDHTISLDPEGFKLLTKYIHDAHSMRGVFGKNTHSEETNGWFYGRRSLYKKESGIVAMRPALHTKDKTVLEAWDYKKIDPSSIRKEGPIRFHTD